MTWNEKRKGWLSRWKGTKPEEPPAGDPDDENPVVIYHRVRCPFCDSDDAPVYNSNSFPIRYHKCRRCGRTFKSIDSEFALVPEQA